MHKKHHVRDVERVHAVVARSTFPSQNKTRHSRTTFGSWDVEKVHAVVARRTFPSQNVQSTPFSDHFWKLRCRTNARRCGTKHISKQGWGPLLDVEISLRVAGTRDCAPCQKWAKKGEGFVAFSTTTHYTTLHYNYNYTFTKFHYTTLHYTQLHSITLHYATLHYIPLHYTTWHYTLHYTTLHCITLHYTTLH